MEYVGKKTEHKHFEFRIPDKIKIDDFYQNTKEIEKQLNEHAQSLINRKHKNEGWIADKYFRSQGSFFNKNNKKWAKVIMRRWI